MGFLGKLFSKKRDKKENKTPVLVATVFNSELCGIYVELLKQHNIPCICRQQGAGGYLKVLTGGFLVSDNIYVDAENYQLAKELYDTYIVESETEFSDGED